MKGSRIFYLILSIIIIVVGFETVYRSAWDEIQRTDYTVYTAVGQAVIDHANLYDVQNIRGWRYVYPPPFAILMVPFAMVSYAMGSFVWYLIEVLSIAACSYMSVALLKERQPNLTKSTPSNSYLIYALPLLSLSVLLISGMMRCQASVFVYALMIATFYFSLEKKPFLSGFSLAAAVLIKVFPLTLVMYFIIRKKWKELLATAVGLIVMGFLLPSLVWGWHQTISDYVDWINVVGHPVMMSNDVRGHTTSLYGQLLDTTKSRNQSLESFLLTLDIPSNLVIYAVAAIALIAFILMWHRSVKIENHHDELTLCGAFIVWSLLITPISETHYFGALILPLTILLSRAVDVVHCELNLKHLIVIYGFSIMILSMILIGNERTEMFRPICIVSILMWGLLIRSGSDSQFRKPAYRSELVVQSSGSFSN